GDEVLGTDRRADRKQTVRIINAEFGDALLQRHLCLGEMLTLRLGDVLLFRLASTKLDGEIAVTLTGAVADDLAILERQDGDRHMAAILLRQAGHPDFFSDHATAHDQTP